MTYIYDIKLPLLCEKFLPQSPLVFPQGLENKQSPEMRFENMFVEYASVYCQ
jgi:hypothetical protein